MSGVKRVFSLYREILRTHRTLPGPMKELGSAYAREEFRLHLRSDKIQEKQWREFISSWEQYVDSLRGGGDRPTATMGGRALLCNHRRVHGRGDRGVCPGKRRVLDVSAV